MSNILNTIPKIDYHWIHNLAAIPLQECLLCTQWRKSEERKSVVTNDDKITDSSKKGSVLH